MHTQTGRGRFIEDHNGHILYITEIMCYSQSVKEATKLPLVRNKKRILLNPYINNHLMFAAPRFEIIKGLLITKGARSRTPGSQENVVDIPLKSKAPVKNMPHSSILSRER